MTRRRAFFRSILLVALAAPACRREAAPAAGQRYPLEGKVVEVDVAGRKITIAHEDIPGFMPAMTMPFVVLEKDAALLQAWAPATRSPPPSWRATRATGSRTSWS